MKTPRWNGALSLLFPKRSSLVTASLVRASARDVSIARPSRASTNPILELESSPFAASPFVTPWLSILACLIESAETAPEVGQIIGMDPRNVRINLDKLKALGFVSNNRRVWTVTGVGIAALRSLASDIASLILNVRITRSVTPFRNGVANS